MPNQRAILSRKTAIPQIKIGTEKAERARKSAVRDALYNICTG